MHNFIPYSNDLERRKKEIIPATFDYVFKTLFKNNPDLLKILIVVIVDELEMKDLEDLIIITDEYTLYGINDNKRISDLVVEIRNSLINIEMNPILYRDVIYKNNSYLTRLKNINEQKLAIQINLDNYNLYNTDKVILKMVMMDKETGITDETFLKNYHVNLDKILEKYYNKEKSNNPEKMCLMLKLKNREELKKVSKGDKIMEKMYEKLSELSEDKKSILLYDKEELDKKCHQEDIDNAVNQAVEKALKEKNLIIKNLLSKDFSIEEISKITNTSVNEIKKLIEK